MGGLSIVAQCESSHLREEDGIFAWGFCSFGER